MSAPELYDPALMPHLIISGLEQYDDRPCMHLGDTTATYAEVRARASQYPVSYTHLTLPTIYSV